jgi:hypothetical protein
MAAPASNLVALDNTRKFVWRWEHVGRAIADILRKRASAGLIPSIGADSPLTID